MIYIITNMTCNLLVSVAIYMAVVEHLHQHNI